MSVAVADRIHPRYAENASMRKQIFWEYSAAMKSATALLALLISAGANAQTVRYIDGVFVAAKEASAPIELIAYAESLSTGILRMQHGTLDDAPLVREISGVMVSVPNWKPAGAFVGTTELFRDERAERRRLSIAAQQRNVYAVALRIADLERRDRIESLLKAVRASYDTPGYAFITIVSGDHVKYFPIRLTPDEP
jgi:hypothetical protein